jgi:RNA polymerase sigma-70 factor (TIGR02960 family)
MVTATTLDLARAGDEDAFRVLTDPYRRELQLHCYRMLGSAQDAEDLLQETMLAAWRALPRFEERSSVRGWLYKIATNRCLNALRASGRRPRAAGSAPGAAPGAASGRPEPTSRVEPIWLEPYPDVLLDDLPDVAPGPEARYETRESVALAFVAGLARLPPRQRAVLVLRDVLGFGSSEAADFLDTSDIAVNSALQRARTALAALLPPDRERAPLPNSPRERAIVGEFVDAFESADVERLVTLLAQDAQLTMPPEPLEFTGRAAIAGFLTSLPWWRAGAARHVPVRANGQPAFGYYLVDPKNPVAHVSGLMVVTLSGDQVCALTRFADNGLAPHFGLPRTLRDV